MALNGILKTPGRKQVLGSKLKDPVEVFCRVRPLNDRSIESCVEILDSSQLQLNLPKNVKSISSQIEQVRCTFTQVFPEHVGQSELFGHVGLPLAEDLINGKNGLCFMYGITGSGKTHTMNGTPTDGGVLPRCLDVLFNSIESFQTNRCIFKPDGYNGFDVQNENDARIENDKKLKELDALARSKKNSHNDMNDIMRIPDGTAMEVDEDCRYAVFISYVEIYNNSVFDLLEDTGLDPIRQRQPSSKILREDPRRNMFVFDVTEQEVKSADEAYEVFWKGQNRRKTAHTLLNTESSRSHSVFTIRLVQAPLGPNGDSIMTDREFIGISQLSLCDLAGSERLSRTKADGDRVREAGNINNSLMTLRSCIETLRENQKNQEIGNKLKIVPYRDSKLTHLYKNYFDGDGKVRMIVCLNPGAEDFDESLHVMRFAEMTQEVKVARSEGVKFDMGLQAGRGKASQAFKKTFENIDDGLSSDMGAQEELVQSIQQFAPWPLLELSSCSDSVTLNNLIEYLKERIRLRRILMADWKQRHTEMRNIILQLEQDNMDLTKALEEQRVRMSEKEKESRSFEKRIKIVSEKNESLQRSFELHKRQTEIELEKQKETIQREKHEKIRLKQTLKDLTSSERLRWEKECDKRVRATQMGMEEKIFAKSEKLRQLRDVVQGLQLPEENQARLSRIIADEKPSHAPSTPSKTHSTTHSSVPSSVQSTHSAQSSSHSSRTRKTPVPKPTHRVKTTKTNMTPKRIVRSKSPPPSAPSRNDVAPVRGRHRRSFSSDYWLEHKPSDTVTTDTVMQPNLKKKRTVDTPNVKDLKTTPNYILTHQEEDSSGEIETQLIKGEVLQTRGGGTSVKFTDIETLKKTLEKKGGVKLNPKPSVTPKQAGDKRKSGDKNDAKSDDSWTDVETRCAVGIESKVGSTPGLMHHAKKSKH